MKRLVGGKREQNREVLPPLAAHYILLYNNTCYNVTGVVCGDRVGIDRRVRGVWGKPNKA